MNLEGLGWTDEDDARLAYEALPDWHPSLFVDAFRHGLSVDPREGNDLLLHAFVTPESVGSWGDFSRARVIFDAGLKISMSAIFGVDAPDVSYVRLVETGEHVNTDISAVPASMHVTLVWRPEIAVVSTSGWRIHHLGEMVRPSQLARTAVGVDPRLER